MVKIASSLMLTLPSLIKSQTILDIDYNLTPGAFEILTNFINDTTWVNLLLEHGCWCAKLDPDANPLTLGGPTPVDELDTICKQWAHSRSCSRQAGNSCENSYQDMLQHYEVEYVYGINDAICPDDDTCLSETCQIDVFYVKKILDWKDAGNQLTPITTPFCGVGKGGGTLNSCESITTTVLPVTTLAYCSCQNGVGAVGADCPLNNAQKCVSCNSGFTLSGSVCTENTCTCENGKGTTGANCPINNSAVCETCNSGYNLQNGACVENVCTCANGIASTSCPTDGENVCQSCNAGYFLNGTSCDENICICSNGDYATGIDCPYNGDSECIKCNSGFYLQNDACFINICTCSNGVGAFAQACPSNNAEVCTSCSNGYYLNNGLCLENACTCQNGNGTVNTACPVNGDSVCEVCDSGFNLQNSACVENVCSCQNGSGAVGLACPVDATEVCSSCDSGYNLQNGLCVENVCTCQNGVGAVNTACATDGSAVCASCNSGYNLQGNSCVENVCICANGVGAVNTACSNNGDAVCASCNAGYDLIGATCILVTTIAPTTLIPTTLMPTTTLSDLEQQCQSVVSDVAFILDGSTSVSVDNFQNAINFMKSVVEPLSVSPTGTQVGMAQYATASRIEFPFQSDKAATYSSLDSIQQIFGTTFTGSAITRTTNELFATYGRAGAMPVIVLITDGVSFDGVVGPANSFKASGGVMFVIGVGDALEFQLRSMASDDPSNPGQKFLWIDDWSALATINIEISEKICSLAAGRSLT